MKKSTLFLMLFTGWYAGIVAQEARPVTISGQIKSDKDSIRLVVWFGKDLVLGHGDEMTKIPVPVKADGTFSFTTPAISQFARLEMFDGYTGNFLFTRDQQFIASGDNITIAATIQDKTAPTYFKAVYSGKGAARFECLQALKTNAQLTRLFFPAKDSLQQTISIYDSLINSKRIILKGYKEKLSKEEYDMILADMMGEFQRAAFINICGYNAGSIHSPRANTEELAKKKKLFDQLMVHFKEAVIDSNIAALSFNYREYLLQKAKAEQVFENNGHPVLITQLFNRIRSQFTGALRDKLLGYLLLSKSENYQYFGGIDPAEYLQCLKDANSVIQSDEVKNRIKLLLAAQVKGAPAFNFSLPMDSSAGKKLTLANLKGKVVLLDLWSYQCTGCVVFSNTFHKKVYPSLQNNPDFAVVSIMLDELADKNKYMYRLRRGGGAVYTFPEYINLFGGKGIASAREMEKYHAIDAYPTIMLIDKQGKIYSSTLPAIYGDPRNKELENNIQKLINLIQQALSEPAAQKPIL